MEVRKDSIELEWYHQIAPVKTGTVILRGWIRTMNVWSVQYDDSTLSHNEGWYQIVFHTWHVKSISDQQKISLMGIRAVVCNGRIYYGDMCGTAKFCLTTQTPCIHFQGLSCWHVSQVLCTDQDAMI